MNKTAVIIGATGLVGGNLLQQLLADDYFSAVKIFVRRTTGIVHPKLQEHILDFDLINDIKTIISGDVLFSCLGTTIKQAGTKAVQYKIDYTYQYEFAKNAADNGVPAYVLISSASANAGSMIFYTRIKGQLEDAVKQLPFSKIRILQPSVLEGERSNKRPGEGIAAAIINPLGKLFPFLKKYRSIPGRTVAAAMIRLYKQDGNEKIKTCKLDELFFG